MQPFSNFDLFSTTVADNALRSFNEITMMITSFVLMMVFIVPLLAHGLPALIQVRSDKRRRHRRRPDRY